MPAEPIVSVVIPARNGERYIGEAIESVLAQTHRALDVIVVDDGSTDGTTAVAADYPVRLRTQGARGLAPARNSGVDLARGEYLAFLDADDVWVTTKLERQLAAFRDDPSLDIALGHVTEFLNPELADAGRAVPRPGLHPAYLPGAALMPLEVWRRVGPARDFVMGDFMDWLLRARDLGFRYEILPDHVLRRRVHTTNLTTTHRERLVDYTHILKGAIDRRRAAEGTNA